MLGIWQYSITLRLDPDSTHMRAGKNNGCVKDAAGTKPRAPSPFRAARTPRNKESTRSISMETWNSDSADGDPYTHESVCLAACVGDEFLVLLNPITDPLAIVEHL